jgi:hypothetical protein
MWEENRNCYKVLITKSERECPEHLRLVGKAVRNLSWMKVALEQDNLGDH